MVEVNTETFPTNWPFRLPTLARFGFEPDRFRDPDKSALRTQGPDVVRPTICHADQDRMARGEELGRRGGWLSQSGIEVSPANRDPQFVVPRTVWAGRRCSARNRVTMPRPRAGMIR